jgi:hypothetical protein
MLGEAATLLGDQGTNPFRVSACRNATDTIAAALAKTVDIRRVRRKMPWGQESSAERTVQLLL